MYFLHDRMLFDLSIVVSIGKLSMLTTNLVVNSYNVRASQTGSHPGVTFRLQVILLPPSALPVGFATSKLCVDASTHLHGEKMSSLRYASPAVSEFMHLFFWTNNEIISFNFLWWFLERINNKLITNINRFASAH